MRMNITYIALTADNRRLVLAYATLDEALDLAEAHLVMCCRSASASRARASTSR
jgi:hypothetical protein